MIAYVFWHYPVSGTDPGKYEQSLKSFHGALADRPPEGFLGSAAFAFSGAPWFPNPSGYLDWYNVTDFASLGVLNEGAVAGARKDAHDSAARLTAAGFGGVYGLKHGRAVFPEAATGTWLKKPAGMSYQDFGAQANPLIDPDHMGLWRRQMALGPGLEFCVLGPNRIEAPEMFAPNVIELRRLV